ncbi:hypothetical protein ACE1AT_12620 [Pelatocladus sp. BLCC-F211]|uniref:hypothetical protein n=1 Tax=Pelatocladus sp. BLCC-F211 TaxID=3342752 RepID=UPI0035B96700
MTQTLERKTSSIALDQRICNPLDITIPPHASIDEIEVQNIIKSFKYSGAITEIVATSEGMLVAGINSLEAAKRLEQKAVLVTIRDDNKSHTANTEANLNNTINTTMEATQILPDFQLSLPEINQISQQIELLKQQITTLQQKQEKLAEVGQKAAGVINAIAQLKQEMFDAGLGETLLTWQSKILEVAGINTTTPEEPKESAEEIVESPFKVGDRVKYTSGGIKRCGVVHEVTESGCHIDEGHPYKSHVAFEYLSLDEEPCQPETQPRGSSTYQKPDTEAIQNFLDGIRSRARLNNTTWYEIIELTQRRKENLRELFLLAKTKLQKEFVQKVPEIIANHIHSTNDDSELDWIGDTLHQQAAEYLTKLKEANTYEAGDLVEGINDQPSEHGYTFEVIEPQEGGWLKCFEPNTKLIHTLHTSEVKLVQKKEEKAA